MIAQLVSRLLAEWATSPFPPPLELSLLLSVKATAEAKRDPRAIAEANRRLRAYRAEGLTTKPARIAQ